MTQTDLGRTILPLTLALVLGAVPARAGSVATPLFAANFNEKVADDPIGTGGPTVNEPISVDSDLSGTVRSTPFATNSLELVLTSTGTGKTARFEFLDGAEPRTCPLTISGKVWFDDLDAFTVKVRESGGAAHNFVSVNFGGTGGVFYSDADSAGSQVGTYSADESITFSIDLDLTAGTYDLTVGGALLLDDEGHGITEAGVGAVLIGFNSAAGTTPMWVDDLLVTNDGALFCDTFESGDTTLWADAVP